MFSFNRNIVLLAGSVFILAASVALYFGVLLGAKFTCTPQTVPVLSVGIVGAGPAGMAAAWRLAEAGHNVCPDRNTFSPKKCNLWDL